MSADEFYLNRERACLLRYFERKGRGDFSVPVPSMHVLDCVATSQSDPLILAAAAERELRALYLGIGQPLSADQARELVESWEIGVADAASSEIEKIEDEIRCLEDEIADLQAKIRERETGGAVDPDYVPDELAGLMRELQRGGA